MIDSPEDTSKLLPGNRIAGQPGDGPIVHAVVDPRDGTQVATVAGGGPDAARRAVDEASAWCGRLDAGERRGLLSAIADRLRAEAASLAATVSQETGKRLAEAEAEVEFSARYFDTFSDVVDPDPVVELMLVDGVIHRVEAQPIGVVAVLTPWNFPLSIPARKIAAAIAAGCGVVFKPSELALRSGLNLAAIIDQASSYAGLLNTVSGGPDDTVKPWLDDARVRSVTFTGSTRVGRLVAGQCASRGIRLTAELGGDAPFVVLDDADLDDAIEILVTAKYRNNGQSCIAANQVWVPRGQLDAVTEAWKDRAAELHVGDPMDADTDLGPLAPAGDPARMEGLADQAARAGAVILKPVEAPAGPGHWAAPTIAVSHNGVQPLAGTEIFGPLGQIAGYRSLEDVAAAINNSPYGLAAYVAGRDPERADAFLSRLDVGIAGFNTAGPNHPMVPFGGRKGSGLGYEGGTLGMAEFLTYQTRALAKP